jgi:hypothetical protein
MSRNIVIPEYSNLKPTDCQARLFVIDKVTGKELTRYKPVQFRANTATPLAKEVAARVLAGSVSEVTPGVFVPYTAAFIEWGTGSSQQPFDPVDPDLEAPFATPVYTPLEAPEFPGEPGVVKFFSRIDETTAGVSLGTSVQEVGLRTAPLAGFDKGILIARFQNDTSIEISSNRVRVGVEWIYIYG